MANIKDISIYGNKKKPEDRVTDALLQIFSYGGHELVSYVIDEIDLPSNEVSIDSQYTSRNSASIPDGRISIDCKYSIILESKLGKFGEIANNHDQAQLKNHLQLCKDDSCHLMYVTNDDTYPNELNAVSVCWMSWNSIVTKLRQYDKQSELLQFLIEQFVKLVGFYVGKQLDSRNVKQNDSIYLPEDGICDEERVIIVGGRWGEEVALKYNFYACQNHRSFKKAKYLAFYWQKRIKYVFKIIGEPEDNVDLHYKTEVINSQYFNELGKNDVGAPRKYFQLEKVNADINVVHNANSAYVQRQRYTSYNKLVNSKTTDEL